MPSTETIEHLTQAGMLVNMTDDPQFIIILAHGAGAGMNHTFLEDMSQLLESKRTGVIRFNFRYIPEGKKFPSSQKQSIEDWLSIFHLVREAFPNVPIFIGGKSYGGRMASHMILELEDQNDVKGVFYLGFPLHSPKKVATTRAEHLDKISIPQLFLQGSNDKLAEVSLIKEVSDGLTKSTFVLFDYADHSFNIPKRNGGNLQVTKEKLAEVIYQWALSQLETN